MGLMAQRLYIYIINFERYCQTMIPKDDNSLPTSVCRCLLPHAPIIAVKINSVTFANLVSENGVVFLLARISLIMSEVVHSSYIY